MKIIISSAKTINKRAREGFSVPVFEDEMNYLLNNGFDKYIKDNHKKMAIDLYNGLVFKYMNKDFWSEKDYRFCDEHILILSALYGVVRPFDNILGYRLDFNIAGKNHYEFYSRKVSEYLKDELIINLASKEFSKLISNKMINIIFYNKEMKSPSTMSKIARGKMVAYIVKNRIENIEDIKKFNNGFKYDENLSNENDIVFMEE